MKSNWKICTLGELCDIKNGYAFKSSDFSGSGIPVIKIKNVKPNKILLNDLSYVPESLAIEKRKWQIEQGTVLLTMTGNRADGSPDSWVGKAAIFQEEGCYLLNQRVAAIIPKTADIDNDFLGYVLSSWETQVYLIKRANSSGGQANISPDIVSKMEIILPPIEEQRKIVSVLASISEKIRINDNINNNLAQQVRALIALWFAEYQPFDGSMPSDWRPILLSEIADFIPGYSYKGDELQQSTTAMASIKNFERGGGFKLDGFKEIVPSDKIKDSHSAELFDILVAHTDLTQKAEVIGNAEPVLNMAGYDKIVFSMDLVKVVPKAGISQFLLAGLLQDPKFKAHCLGYVNGTTVLHLSKKALPEYELLFPTKVETLRPLSDALESIYRKQAAVMEENRSLEVLRDALLPRLMSGEIDVSDVKI